MKTNNVNNFEKRTLVDKIIRTVLLNVFIWGIVTLLLTLILSPIILEKKELFEVSMICGGIINFLVALLAKPATDF